MADDEKARSKAPLKEPLRILSDLHLGHPASRIRSASSLAALLDGVATLIINGDVCEQRCRAWRERGDVLLAGLREMAATRGVELVLLRGNHDPWASEKDWLDLAGGAVFVTHGDALYRHISPWSPKVMKLRAEMDAEWSAVAADEIAIGEWFDVVQRCRTLKPSGAAAIEEMQGLGPLTAPFRLLWPAWRVPVMLRSWWQAPGLAADLCHRFRPRARFVIIGHTHWHGLWRRGGRQVINTGGFLSLGGRTLVDLGDGRLRVCRVECDKPSENYRIGREVAGFEL